MNIILANHTKHKYVFKVNKKQRSCSGNGKNNINLLGA